MLVAVVPCAGEAGVKAQQGEGAHHILVQGIVVAVDVVRHLQWQQGKCNGARSVGGSGEAHMPMRGGLAGLAGLLVVPGCENLRMQWGAQQSG